MPKIKFGHRSSNVLLSLLDLQISTRIRVHRDFSKSARLFAFERGLELARDVHQRVLYKTVRNVDEPIITSNAHVHLGRQGGVRVRNEFDGAANWITGIEFNPSQFLFGDPARPFTLGGFQHALTVLRDQISLMLADAGDRQHIIPGLAAEQNHIAYWNTIECGVIVNDVDLGELHSISHPVAGSVAGATAKCAQLGVERDDLIIRFEREKSPSRSRSLLKVPLAIRATLALQGESLRFAYRDRGASATMGSKSRLIAFHPSDLARVHQAEMARLKGLFLPKVEEWQTDNRNIKPARVVALLATLAGTSSNDLRSLKGRVLETSPSTKKRLDGDITKELARLDPRPIASLFPDELYRQTRDVRVESTHEAPDASIAAVYG